MTGWSQNHETSIKHQQNKRNEEKYKDKIKIKIPTSSTQQPNYGTKFNVQQEANIIIAEI